ncbi:MAG: hypothetical protein GX330_00615 [Bacteroidales bacterium]|nr:hypothetical protein [Bacteroidales bacterium]
MLSTIKTYHKIERISLMFVLLFVFIYGCNNKSNNQVRVPQIENLEEKLVGANKLIVRDESKDIQFLLKRYQWEMKSTGTGMFYAIDTDEKAPLIEKGDEVEMEYSISLINGKEVYNSKIDGIKTLIVEQSDEPIGLHELLKMMRFGDKAKAIIPSHMAYGILGDNDQIPPYATLIYRIEIINVYKK